jgi:hypothetical protein
LSSGKKSSGHKGKRERERERKNQDKKQIWKICSSFFEVLRGKKSVWKQNWKRKRENRVITREQENSSSPSWESVLMT